MDRIIISDKLKEKMIDFFIRTSIPRIINNE